MEIVGFTPAVNGGILSSVKYSVDDTGMAAEDLTDVVFNGERNPEVYEER